MRRYCLRNGVRKMDMDRIKQLVELVTSSSLTSLEIEDENGKIRMTNSVGGQPVPAAKSAAEPQIVIQDTPGKAVKSPIVGVYHNLSAAGKPDLQVGDHIAAGDVVCVIEAMKLMNEVESDLSGEIVEILVKEGQAVEYGQPLLKVKE